MKVVIIGGAAGGASLAARLRRIKEKVQITIIERGPSVSYAACALPYFVGDEVTSEDGLYAASSQLLDKRYRIRVKDNNTAVSIDPKEKCVWVKNILRQSEKVYYDKLVIAAGSDAVLPDFAQGKEGVFALKTVNDAKNVKAYIKNCASREAIVVGGGFIGLEAAENLVRQNFKVTLIEKAPQVLAPLDSDMAGFVQSELKDKGVTLLLNTGLADIKEEHGRLTAVTDSGKALTSDLILMAAGVKPNSKLAQDCGIECDSRGYILVSGKLQTSEPDIFALGDATVLREASDDRYKLMALASPAQKQSRVLASVLAKLTEGEDGDLSKIEDYKGSVGTSIVRVFGIAAGCTGFNWRALKDRPNTEKLTVHAASHVSWYPGSSPVHLKLIFDKTDGTVLGAQAVGAADADKALEVLSLAVQKNLTVKDLVQLESAYAPPFSAPRSPVNMAAAAALNVVEGLMQVTDIEGLQDFDKENTVFADVRSPEEFAAGSIPGFINLPLEELRVKIGMEELDKNKTYVITCQVGVRGHIACCILKGCGFDKVYNLTGGYVSYQNYAANLEG